MGPNGSGKSTWIMFGRASPLYKVRSGRSCSKGESLPELEPNASALRGIFLAFPISGRDYRRRRKDFSQGGVNARGRPV